MCCLFSGFFWGVILIIIGLLIIIKVFLKLDIPFFRILFSLLIIYIGIKILIGGFAIKTGGNLILFGESTIEVTELGKEYNIVFGKGVIDLSKAPTAERSRSMKINTVFGRGEVKIDPEMSIIVETNSVFAETITPDGNQTHFGKYTYKTEKYSKDTPHIRIEADVVFGSLEILDK